MSSLLYLYQSSDLNQLGEQFAHKIRGEKPSPFYRDQVILQTKGIETWLTQKCAKVNAISAGIEFSSPAPFLHKLYFQLTGHSEERTIFERGNMRWFIFRLLKESPELFPELSDYLESSSGNEEQKLLSFASQMSDLMDSYILYRPDLLTLWEGNETGKATDKLLPHEAWQRRIWQKIVEFNRECETVGDSPIETLVRLNAILTGKDITHKQRLREWSERNRSGIYLFSMSILPPTYQEIFSVIAQNIDVHLFILNPSQFYWGDTLTDRRSTYLKQMSGSDSELYLTMGNQLLRNLGEVGRDFYQTLYQYSANTIVEIDSFPETEPTTLLSHIQNDILTWEDTDRTELLDLPRDHSVTINNCYSPLREIEVLYDYLLSQFEQNPELTTSDILVVAPELDTYAPLIPFAFSTTEEDFYNTKRLTAKVTDQSVLAESPWFQLLRDIFKTPQTNYEAAQILGMFEQYSLLSEKPLNSDDVDRLRIWISESGIRWGIDDLFWHEQTETDFGRDRFNWRSGESRMVLGYALGSVSDASFGEHSSTPPPYDEIEGSSSELLGELLQFTHTLFQLYKSSRSSAKPEIWESRFITLVESLYIDDTNEDVITPKNVTTTAKILRKIVKEFTVAGSSEIEVNYGTFTNTFLNELDSEPGETPFLRGEITFATTIPHRSIPFKIIAMIGMDHNSFPRRASTLSFDLMAEAPRPGDRNSRKGDLYLFLENLISAQDSIYLSWQGKDNKGTADIPSSPVIDQLLDYIDNNYLFDGDSPENSIVSSTPLHPFSKEYDPHGELVTYQSKWFPELFTEQSPRIPFEMFRVDTPLEEGSLFTASDIVSYLDKPIEQFFTRRLNLREPNRSDDLDSIEPFTTDHLTQYILRKDGVSDVITGEESRSKTEKELYYKGVLPVGPSWEQAQESISGEVQRIVDRVPMISEYSNEEIIWEREIDGYLFQFTFDNCFRKDDSVLVIEPGKLIASIRQGDFGKWSQGPKLKRWFTLRLIHLVTNCDSPTSLTAVALDQSVTFDAIESKEAETELLWIIRLFIDGQSSMQPYFGNRSYETIKKPALIEEIVENMSEGYENLFSSRVDSESFDDGINTKQQEIAERLFKFIEDSNKKDS